MAIKQDPNTILGVQNDPIASQTEIALALANGGLYQYQTTKDIYVTAVSQRITNQQVINTVNEVAGSSTGEVQFYNGGKFAADKDFRYDTASDSLYLGGNLYAGKVQVQGTSNLFIPGGLPGYVLTTNGAGTVTWSAASTGSTTASGVSFTPAGGLTSTDVQSAIIELSSKAVASANFANFAGNVTVAAQPNITSVGTLTSLTVSGLITGNGGGLSNINGANITGAIGFASVANSVAGANVVGAVALATSATTANSVAGANVVGAVALATNATTAATANSVAGANVVGNVTSAITANFANFAGNVTVAAQPNITSVGTLTSLTVSGLITGDGGGLSNITGANITGAIGFATVANSVAGANVTGTVALATAATTATTAGTVTTAAQPNITSVGTLTSLVVTGTTSSGNVITGGNVTAAGNIEADTAFVGNALTTRTGPLTLTATGASNLTLAVGTGNINLSTQAYITNVKDPVSAQDAATKNYVDALSQGLKPKSSVQCATTVSITLSPAPATIDGFTLVNGTRVLVKNQATASQNGIYSFDGTNLVRAADADSAVELTDGTFVYVESGTTYGSSGHVQTATVTTLGTDPVTFSQFSTGGSYTAGPGLTLTGSQFSVSTTGITAGSHGNATHVPTFTVTATGQLTAAGNVAVVANAETLAGTTLKSTVVTSSLTTVGTLTTLAVTGNTASGNFTTGGQVVSTGNVVGGNVTTVGVVTATGNVSGGNITTGGQVVATGNVTGSNVTTAGVVTATGTITGGNLVTAGNASVTGNLSVTSKTNLGAVGNVTITGGTAGQYLQTNGSGVLVWASAGGASIANGTSNVNIAALNGDVTVGVAGTTKLTVTSTSANIVGIANVSGNIVTAGNVIATGNVTGGNVTTAGVVTATGTITGGNLITAGAANSATLNVAGVSNLNAVGNVIITGGTAGQVLQTNGSGNLTWATQPAANVTFTASGNIANTTVQTAIAELDAEKIKTIASSTDNAIVRWDLTTGTLIQDSLIKIDDTGNLGNVATLTADTTYVKKRYYSVFENTAASGSIDCTLSNYFVRTFAAATPITLTAPGAGATDVYSCTIQLTLGAAGSVSSWPAVVKWPSGTAPTLTASKTHLIMLVTANNGTTWYATSLTDY